MPSEKMTMARLLQSSLLLAAVLAGFSIAVDPEEIYDGGYGNSSILLNIGNGGAGQSGLVKGA